MNDPSPRELELTPDLLEYAKAIAIKEAQKHCPGFVKYADVAQEVALKLICKPPKYDPLKGASAKTLIYTIVQRNVLKYVGRERRNAGRFNQVFEQKPAFREPKEGKLIEPVAGTTSARARMIYLEDLQAADDAVRFEQPAERHPRDFRTKSVTIDDILEFVDSEESRSLCRLVIDCNGNVSEAARRLDVSEGTVRYRLKLLAPKLIAAGFNPFGRRECG
jgi:RNA polymerase sigma factor (sigma-70 family)